MKPFRYERASDASTAVAMLAQASEDAFLGGGTNLVDLIKLGVAQSQLLAHRDGGCGLNISCASQAIDRNCAC